jgi:hypothetical protein
MRWNLRLAAANRDIWKASELQRRLAEHGLVISAGKMSGLWSGNPASVAPAMTSGGVIPARPAPSHFQGGHGLVDHLFAAHLVAAGDADVRPSLASATATARPMPLVVPVTNAETSDNSVLFARLPTVSRTMSPARSVPPFG